ncbi:hypothetical protein Aduo_006813 [Ancylostoma duodenale]
MARLAMTARSRRTDATAALNHEPCGRRFSKRMASANRRSREESDGEEQRTRYRRRTAHMKKLSIHAASGGGQGLSASYSASEYG